uniref:Uncharacterized protein n=1 Tax=Salix viminalis TaxID=40686 RepID=A0A6N2K8U0_SALVM
MSLRFKEEEGMELINDFIDHIRAVPPQQGSSKEATRVLSFVMYYMVTTGARISRSACSSLELFHRLDYQQQESDRSLSKTLKQQGFASGQTPDNDLTDVKFKSTVLGGILELPRFTIDDSSKSLLLNLMEYEWVVDTSGELWVTSYICFLDSLIQDEVRCESAAIRRHTIQ